MKLKDVVGHFIKTKAMLFLHNDASSVTGSFYNEDTIFLVESIEKMSNCKDLYTMSLITLDFKKKVLLGVSYVDFLTYTEVIA